MPPSDRNEERFAGLHERARAVLVDQLPAVSPPSRTRIFIVLVVLGLANRPGVPHVFAWLAACFVAWMAGRAFLGMAIANIVLEHETLRVACRNSARDLAGRRLASLWTR